MPMRGRALQPSTVSKLLVRVDVYGEDCFAGRLYSPHLGTGCSFGTIMELVDTMDLVFDTIGFPVAAANYRNFLAPISVSPITARNKKVPVPQFTGDKDITLDPGDANVFHIHVQLRQNATWQGTVSYDTLPETRFQSTLGLIKILSACLTPEQGPVGQAI